MTTLALHPLSPSQLSCVAPAVEGGCPRKWGFRYIDKIQTPESRSAQEGTAVHACLEQYYRDGVMKLDTWFARVAVAALAYLPPFTAKPHSEFVIESLVCANGLFGRSTSEGTDVTGREVRIDVYDPFRRSTFQIGPEGDEWARLDAKGRPVPLVCDLKTTGDFKYQATVVKLRGDGRGYGMDPQVLIYGKKAIVDFQAAYDETPAEIHCRWVYALRDEQKPRARVTDFVVTPAEIETAEREWSVPVQAIHVFRLRQLGSSSLPPNLAACSKYGGCGYGPGSPRNPGLNVCQLTDEEEMERIMASDVASLNNVLNTFMQAAASAAPAPQVAATATTPPSLPSGQFGTNPAAFAAPLPAPINPAPPEAPVAPPAPQNPDDLSADLATLLMNCPEDKRLGFVEYLVAQGTLNPAQATKARVLVSPPAATPVQALAAVVEAAAAQEPPARAKPGRPRKAALAEVDVAAPAAAGIPVGVALTGRLERAFAVGLRAAADYLDGGDG